MVRLLRLFGRSRRGVAALEFALLAPVLIMLFLGGFELARFINTTRRLSSAANSIANMISQNTTGSVNQNDILFSMDSTMLIFPAVLSDSKSKNMSWWTDIRTSISSIAFTPTVTGCTSSCTYTAKVVWSVGSYRPCTVNLTAASDTATPSATTLPTDVFGPGSLIVVDLIYTYTPIVATKLFGSTTLYRSAYIQPRYVSQINYDWSLGWVAQIC